MNSNIEIFTHQIGKIKGNGAIKNHISEQYLMSWRKYSSMSSKNAKYIAIYNPDFAKRIKQKKYTGNFIFFF